MNNNVDFNYSYKTTNPLYFHQNRDSKLDLKISSIAFSCLIPHDFLDNKTIPKSLSPHSLKVKENQENLFFSVAKKNNEPVKKKEVNSHGKTILSNKSVGLKRDSSKYMNYSLSKSRNSLATRSIDPSQEETIGSSVDIY
ncbi:MAG: hypothetical protein ACOVOR_00360 [Rhabdochlamydiaceae bacterium]